LPTNPNADGASSVYVGLLDAPPMNENACDRTQAPDHYGTKRKPPYRPSYRLEYTNVQAKQAAMACRIGANRAACSVSIGHG
jgi:hypothetical protein